MVTASPDIAVWQGQGEAVEEGGEDEDSSGQGEAQQQPDQSDRHGSAAHCRLIGPLSPSQPRHGDGSI